VNAQTITVSGRKLNKERLIALVCANAHGFHRLKPVITGKLAKPRLLRHIMEQLPVIYIVRTFQWFNRLRETRLSIKLFKRCSHQKFLYITSQYVSSNIVIIKCLKLFFDGNCCVSVFVVIIFWRVVPSMR
jgi:hypothetical protein